ncbi:FeoA family protein [Fusobacterium sp.]|uniref:FeoA family protein n=1 Tax=Fusobacterium sp. TaxID=68766 RepID=UPI00260E18B6|nr:FeoA family protein [Fusobacterium sp.]
MIIPLAFADLNKNFKIVEISEKCKHRKSLIEKGFCIGNIVTIKNSSNGNFIVEVNGSQYVLGFNYAKNILVE